MQTVPTRADVAVKEIGQLGGRTIIGGVGKDPWLQPLRDPVVYLCCPELPVLRDFVGVVSSDKPDHGTCSRYRRPKRTFWFSDLGSRFR